MVTEKIVVTGLVQGIGFRPFITELAEAYKITGTVCNHSGIVQIIATGEVKQLTIFRKNIKEKAPLGAKIESMENTIIENQKFDRFSIIESTKTGDEAKEIQILEDIPTCAACEEELLMQKNRRYRYPFISCTACGPRYSIIEKIPYDRENTVMKEFELCADCKKEYLEKGNIRRHAQTIACPNCGPQLTFLSKTKKMKKEEAFVQAVELIKSEGILALKDIGGFHLVCSPYSKKAVRALRELKGREKKPFAVMFQNIQEIKKYGEVSEEEKQLLASVARPIVLLKKKENTEKKSFAAEVSKNSSDIGAMLPCNPLQILLLQEFKALIMTSANRSGEPMIIENSKMEAWMQEIEEIPFGILEHDRKILTPLDDSIVRIIQGRQQIFRRSRGYVPKSIPIEHGSKKQVFAAGGDLKAAFCFTNGEKAYLSQYLGDMQDEEIERLYVEQLHRMEKLFHFSPKYFAADMHPNYLSVRAAIQYAISQNQESVNLHKIQHHHAHIASVIAEHGLKGKTLGVAFDGTGYGTDGTIWGSEFLLCEEKKMERAAHLKPVLLIGGNEGAKNTDTILYGYLTSFLQKKHIFEFLAGTEWFSKEKANLIEAAVTHRINCVSSTSMGRLFDAVSALLDICHYNSYEGEAAIELEYLAARADIFYPLELTLEKQSGKLIGNTEALFWGILEGMQQGISKSALAKGFLMAVSNFVVDTCMEIAREQKINQVALSGGTFQNRILTENVIEQLEQRETLVYLNEKVPSGDGGICLGQAYLA